MKPINKKNFGSNGIQIQFHNGAAVVTGYITRQISYIFFEATANGVDKFKVRLAATSDAAAALTPGYATIKAANADGSVANACRITGTVLHTTSGARLTWTTAAGTPAAGAARIFTKVVDGLPVLTGHAAAYANLLTSATDLTLSPPWYVGAGEYATKTAQRLVVAPGDTRQTAMFQTISVVAGKTYVIEMNYDKVPGSGAGFPRATFYKLGDANSTYANATLTTSGNRCHTSSIYTATATGDLRAYIEMPSSTDNGCDITIFNFGAGEASAPSYNATDIPYVPPADPFSDMMKAINFPTDLPPANAAAVPAFGTLAANTAGQKVNLVSIDYRTMTRDQIDATHFQSMITGDQNGDATIGDTADPTVGNSYGLVGRWPKGHALDNIIPTVDGVKLKVNNKTSDGSIYKFGGPRAALLRLEQNIRPGMYVEVTFKGPRNRFAWMPIWLYNGRQTSYKRVNKALGLNLTSTYANPTIDGATRYLLDFGSGYKEIDNLDMYFKAPGPGRVLTSGIVWKGNTGLSQTKVSPYRSFVAADNGFTASNGLAALPAASEWYQGFNTLGVYLPDDGSNLVQYIWNGKVFQEEYYEFYGPDLADPLPPHNIEPTGFHLIMGGQFAATFQTMAADGSGSSLVDLGKPALDLTGVDPDDFSMTIQKVNIWRGAYTPASRGTNSIAPTFAALGLTAQPTAIGAFSTAITGRTAGSTIVAKSSNNADTGISVVNGTLNITVADTAARTITLVEHPTSSGGNLAYGVPRTSTVTMQVNASAPADTAKNPSEIAGNLITRDNLAEQVGSSSTTGWNHTSGSTITGGQTDRSGTTKAWRWQCPTNNGNIEYYLPTHAEANASLWIKASANCIITSYSPNTGAVDRQILASDGWKQITGIFVGQNFQLALYNNYASGNPIDVLISDVKMI